MKRELSAELAKWKNSENRKPLIIQGARQVGKTWLMQEFGKTSFAQVVYLNFESSERLRSVFVNDFNIERLISVFEIETKVKIDARTTLLIFDEIQEAEKGLTALKYFYENAPEYYVVAAGSLLGLSLQHKNSFPVGKVDFLNLSPISFLEFLEILGETELVGQVKNKHWEVVGTFHELLIEKLRLYYFIGGMPEVVAAFEKTKDLTLVRDLQQKIILGYENDFAKHAPHNIVQKIRLVWHSLLSQLAKENRKFIYGQIKKGARAKDFEDAINWLVAAGLVLKINRVDIPTLPLNAYADMDSFKLYFIDIGLLNAKGNLDQSILLNKNAILKEFKGASTEQFVCQNLYSKHELFYWTAPNATAEIDFLLQNQNEIIPIEVKSEENLKSKSLKLYVDRFSPKLAIRTSMNQYREEKWLTNVPLYAIETIAP
jgi:predicted AAA+ superfamily ATPase